MNFKDILGLIATAIAFIAYIPYFKDIFSGKTKPHAFSWLIWGSLAAIEFAGQISDHAGPGAWVTGFSAFVCFFIFLAALKKGEKKITSTDWLSLAGAGIALIFWYFTKGPLISVILITVIDALGFLPTIRKSITKPSEETVITYILNGLKFVIALFALEKVSLITALYPTYLITANWFFVLMLIIRKKQIK